MVVFRKIVKRRYEAFLIKVAIAILKGRNVKRADVVSRKDNNQMYYMCDHLEHIASKIQSDYE